MSIMLIFFGDITYNPLQGPAPKNGPAAAWTWPHGAPRPTTIPRRICQPHELLRAQRTPPQPPDFGGGGPSCPASSAAPVAAHCVSHTTIIYRYIPRSARL